MLRHFSLLGGLALALCLAANASAQSFSNFYAFGDSLSDSGNVAQQLGLPAGSSFITNPDPVAAERIAEAFGTSGRHSLAGGPNHAWAGACMTTEGSCARNQAASERVPTIQQQIDQHLSGAGGRADPKALYFLWGGLNDIDDALSSGGAANSTALATEAAAAHVGQIARLLDAGARYVVVPNLPDLSILPFTARLPESAGALLVALGRAYDETLRAGIRAREEGVVPVNVLGMAEEITRSPRAYGFTELRTTACPLNENPLDRTSVSLVCGPEGSGYPKTYAAGANRSRLFADDKHPGGAAHAIIADMVVSTLAAPLVVSLAGEAGAEAMAAHHAAAAAEREADLASGGPAGAWRVWAAARAGRSELDALPRLGENEADSGVVTLGAVSRAGPNLAWGFAASLARHENEIAGSSLESEAVVGSMHAIWRSGALSVSGAVSLGEASVDIRREFSLGAASRSESGDTDASLFGGELEAGWRFGGPAGVGHGPFAGVSWLDQEVRGYREKGNSSTAMNFRGFDRDSLLARAGYRFAFRLGGWGRSWARLAYEREFKDDPARVSAGSNAMPGRFTMPGFSPPDGAARAEAGLAARLGERASARLGYAGRFGDGASHGVSLSVRAAF